jgi:hypothetical protein
MSEPLQIELERLRYWQGQRLRARDFRDQLAIEAQLRQWHNRALHSVYGVSMGFIVSAVPANGTLRALQVTCGLAYDCFGRGLILQGTREIPVPPAPPPEGNRQVTTLTLLLRYKEETPRPQRHGQAASYLPCFDPGFEGEPDLVWRKSDHVQVTNGVPIAQVNFDNQTASLDQQFKVPLSRPLARPHLASGETLPGHTVWEAWFLDSPVIGRPAPVIGLQTSIDTSAAGFTQTPCYFAWLQGSLVDGQGQPLLCPYFANIAAASPTGFIFRLLLPEVPNRDRLLGGTVAAGLHDHVQVVMEAVSARRRAMRTQTHGAHGQGLYVCWLGCQMERRLSTMCPGSAGSQVCCP